jgi:ribosome biogenesis GTPase / thiamine phosphate phosphatase
VVRCITEQIGILTLIDWQACRAAGDTGNADLKQFDDHPESWKRPSGIPDEAMPGIVVRSHGKFFTVRLREQPRDLLSTLKGTLKRVRQKTDIVAVGDRVWVTDVGDNEGRIEAVLPRRAALTRLARGTRDTEQVILANPDQVMFIFAVRHPEPHLRMLDRFLILAESEQLPAIIGVNKIDLDLPDPDDPGRTLSRSLFAPYEPVYPVLYFSASTCQGLDRVNDILQGTITAVAGPSGVGKSSLLNALHPAGERLVAQISEATGKGRHTTTSAELHQIGSETYVADTPGMRALALGTIDADRLDEHFREFRPFLGQCFYADCLHISEPGCEVLEAVERGDISRARYESYAALKRGEVELEGGA